MAKFTSCILLLVFTILFVICQKSSGCTHGEGPHQKPGIICYAEVGNFRSCCLPDHTCLKDGNCGLRSGPPPSTKLLFHTNVVVGIGVSVFCIVCVVFGAVYWHRRQMHNTEKRINPLSSFTQSHNPSRSGSSAGFRVRSSTSQAPSVETNVNLGLPKNTAHLTETV